MLPVFIPLLEIMKIGEVVLLYIPCEVAPFLKGNDQVSMLC